MILLIDNYDSFSYNVYQWIGTEYPDIHVARNDEITIEEVRDLHPDAIVLSPGPKRPEDAGICIDLIRTFYKEIPILGICLGHQLLALTLGGTTTKLKFGHRGCNHPVKDLERNMVHITSQNHGYVVDQLPKGVVATHVNINDGTIEGMKHTTLPIYSVQFHPEAAAGPVSYTHLTLPTT